MRNKSGAERVVADIVFICVRDDVARAEALAEAFDAAGFSVETEFDDDALGACAAGVVVLSRAAAQSETFVEAAHWAIDADKAVVASLVEVPTVNAETTQVFDLSAWDGDAKAVVLEPLICAIDRLALAARAPASELVVEVEPPAAERWAELPPLKLEPMSPRAAPKRPRAYLPIAAERAPFRFSPRMVIAAATMFVFAAGAEMGAHFAPRAAPATQVAADVAPIEPVTEGAPAVPFTDVVIASTRAERVVYNEAPPLSVLSPSRAEPPSASRVLREVRAAQLTQLARYARTPHSALRSPTFIDDAPA